MDEAVVVGQPGDGPLDRSMAPGLVHAPDERLVGDEAPAFDLLGQVILEPVGKAEHRFGRNFRALDQGRRAMPAHLDAAVEIGLGPRHPEQAVRVEPRGLAEDVRVGPEPDLGAATVGDAADGLELAERMPAFEDLPVEHLPARDFHLEPLRQGVDHRDADPVQTARGLVGAQIEFSAGVQRGHDHFEGGAVGEFRVRIDRNAAAVVGDAAEAVVLEVHVDEAGVTRHRLVHGVVDDFGEEVVEPRLVGAADEHARATPDRLEPFQNLDRRGRVAGFVRRAFPSRRRCDAALAFPVWRWLNLLGRRVRERLDEAEQIVFLSHIACTNVVRPKPAFGIDRNRSET